MVVVLCSRSTNVASFGQLPFDVRRGVRACGFMHSSHVISSELTFSAEVQTRIPFNQRSVFSAWISLFEMLFAQRYSANWSHIIVVCCYVRSFHKKNSNSIYTHRLPINIYELPKITKGDGYIGSIFFNSKSLGDGNSVRSFEREDAWGWVNLFWRVKIACCDLRLNGSHQ